MSITRENVLKISDCFYDRVGINKYIKGVDLTLKKIMETIYDSPVELNVDYRILLSMVTCSKGDVTNIAKEIINKVKETYKDKVLESLIRLQSKSAQLQTFDVNYFAIDYETSYGQDYRKLDKEVEDAINEY